MVLFISTRSKCTETNECGKFMYATDCSKQCFNQQLVTSVATPYHHRVNIHGHPINTWWFHSCRTIIYGRSTWHGGSVHSFPDDIVNQRWQWKTPCFWIRKFMYTSSIHSWRMFERSGKQKLQISAWTRMNSALENLPTWQWNTIFTMRYVFKCLFFPIVRSQGV